MASISTIRGFRFEMTHSQAVSAVSLRALVWALVMSALS